MNLTIALDIIVILACVACGWMTYLDWRLSKRLMDMIDNHHEGVGATLEDYRSELLAHLQALRLRVLKLEGKVIAVVTGKGDAQQAPVPGSDTRA